VLLRPWKLDTIMNNRELQLAPAGVVQETKATADLAPSRKSLGAKGAMEWT